MTTKEYYRNHKEKLKTKNKEYYLNHKEKLKTKHKEYYNKHKEEFKKYHLKNRYSLSISKFNNLLLAQNMKCAICKEPLDLQNPHNVNIDHDHKTGKIRGILCNKCNVAIGLLRDNPEYAYSAFIYLKKGD